jgi:ABC-type uncharacterized transport system substrate-binding protein
LLSIDTQRENSTALNRAKPSDLPIEQARKFGFVINMNAAKQIGLTISPSVQRPTE